MTNSIDICGAVRAILDEDNSSRPAHLPAEVLRRTGADARTALQAALAIVADEFHSQHDREEETVINFSGDDADALAREYQRARYEHPDADRDTLATLIRKTLGREIVAELDAEAEEIHRDLHARDLDDGAVTMFVNVAEHRAQC